MVAPERVLCRGPHKGCSLLSLLSSRLSQAARWLYKPMPLSNHRQKWSYPRIPGMRPDTQELGFMCIAVAGHVPAKIAGQGSAYAAREPRESTPQKTHCKRTWDDHKCDGDGGSWQSQGAVRICRTARWLGPGTLPEPCQGPLGWRRP